MRSACGATTSQTSQKEERPNAPSGLNLSARHCLNAGSENLGQISAGRDCKRNGAALECRKFAVQNQGPAIVQPKDNDWLRQRAKKGDVANAQIIDKSPAKQRSSTEQRADNNRDSK